MTSTYSNYAAIAQYSEWLAEANQRTQGLPAEWLPWLLDRGSLTSALTVHSDGEFRVRVLSERWQRPHSREALKLGIPQHLAARVREVELLCNQQVMVYARSIIPLAMFQQEPYTFQGMGSKPLGHLLFQDGRARNRQRSLCIFKAADGKRVYGRATPYEYHGGEILVSEFFVNPSLVSS